MRLSVRGILGTAAVLLSLAIGLKPQVAMGGGGDVARGKALFEGKGGCVSCHGAGGRGDGPAARMLVPPPKSLADPKVKAKSDEDLMKAIQEGRPGTGMVGFKGLLSDQDIRDLVVYVRSLSK